MGIPQTLMDSARALLIHSVACTAAVRVIWLCARRSDLFAIDDKCLRNRGCGDFSFYKLLVYAAAPCAACGGRYASPRASIAHTMRTFLAASATAAMLSPRRARSRSTQRLNGSFLPRVVFITERAPWTKSVRKYVSPRPVMGPIQILPPVPLCLGTIPNQAVTARPFLKSFASPMVATAAVAVIGPMPRASIRRRARPPFFAQA